MRITIMILIIFQDKLEKQSFTQEKPTVACAGYPKWERRGVRPLIPPTGMGECCKGAPRARSASLQTWGPGTRVRAPGGVRHPKMMTPDCRKLYSKPPRRICHYSSACDILQPVQSSRLPSPTTRRKFWYPHIPGLQEIAFQLSNTQSCHCNCASTWTLQSVFREFISLPL